MALSKSDGVSHGQYDPKFGSWTSSFLTQRRRENSSFWVFFWSYLLLCNPTPSTPDGWRFIPSEKFSYFPFFTLHHIFSALLCVSRPLAALRVRFAQATRRLRRGRISPLRWNQQPFLGFKIGWNSGTHPRSAMPAQLVEGWTWMTSLQPMTHGISQWQLSPKRQISDSSQPPCVANATFNSAKRTTPSPNANNDIKPPIKKQAFFAIKKRFFQICDVQK